jgi:hypothetical protein
MHKIITVRELIVVLLLIASINTFDFRTWMSIGRRFCKPDIDKDKYQALLKCDQKITEAVCFK